MTNSLGAVARTVLETLRTLLVWVLDLALYYGAPLGTGVQLGEPWSSTSWLQVSQAALGAIASACGNGSGKVLQAQARLKGLLHGALML